MTIQDPDSLVLYSTIVLESLFSSKTDKQELTSRIADLTAALLGNNPIERYELAKKLKIAYGQRSDFVHGAVDRPRQYAKTAMWMFKIATLALWETVQLVAIDEKFSDWDKFHDYVQRRKYGVKQSEGGLHAANDLNDVKRDEEPPAYPPSRPSPPRAARDPAHRALASAERIPSLKSSRPIRRSQKRLPDSFRLAS